MNWTAFENILLTIQLIGPRINDTLFFHANLLHCSSRNNSDTARWSMISAYNLASNRPFLEEPASSYTPVNKLPDKTIHDFAARKISADADFLNPVNDKSLKK